MPTESPLGNVNDQFQQHLFSPGPYTQAWAEICPWYMCTINESSRGLQNGAALAQAQLNTPWLGISEVSSPQLFIMLVHPNHVWKQYL